MIEQLVGELRDSNETIRIMQMAPGYWYAVIQKRAGIRLEARGGFAAQEHARAWAMARATRADRPEA